MRNKLIDFRYEKADYDPQRYTKGWGRETHFL